MTEVIELLHRLMADMRFIKTYLHSINKSKIEQFQDTWIDGQDVMIALHISKRTLQNLRDTGVLPYSRINGKFYYRVEDIESLLENNYSPKRKEASWN